MSRKQSLVEKMSSQIIKIISFIFSIIYLILVCLPLAAGLWAFVTIYYFIADVRRFLKKTIKNEKTKPEPIVTESLS